MCASSRRARGRSGGIRDRWRHALGEPVLRILTPRRLLALGTPWRYAVALLIVALATLLRWALIPVVRTETPYNLLLLATVVTTLFLGFGPGVAAVLVGAVAVEAVVLGSIPGAFDGLTALRMGLAIAVGVFIAGILAAIRAGHEILEQRIEARTAEARGLADQLRALASRLSRAEQSERKRVATILHDHIQQLLVAARMQLQRVERSGEDEGRAAARSVDAILAEAIEASRSLTLDLSPPVLDQSGLVAALEWLAKRMETQALFRVRIRASRDDEPASEPLRLLLFESARELLLNALKHSGVREARLTLSRASDGSIRMRVEDDGVGFDGAPPASGDRSGFGVFSIQQRLAHVGGRLEIESARGRGTRVTLVAPADLAPADAEESRRPVAAGRRISVLLADDHHIVRQGLASMFRFEPDIEVTGEATNGREAVDLARSLRPDVVVMDVNMPVMSGVEATRAITAELPEVRVIALSMHADNNLALAMKEAGAVGYLTKGGSPVDLVNAVRTCVGGYE